MRLQHIRTLDELDDLKSDWKTLEKVEGGSSIFQSWTWNRLWVDLVLREKKQWSLDVQILEEGSGRILAILPFFEESVLGPFVKLTQFLGHRMSYHNDILLVDPKNSELAEGVIRVLIDDIGTRTVLHLRHLCDESLFTKQLLARRFAVAQCTRVSNKIDPTIRDQRIRLGRSKRKTLRWAENKLRKEFNREFRIVSSIGFSKAFDELIDLHQRRFDSLSRSTFLEGTNLTFLKAASLKLSKLGVFEITQLIAGGKAISAMLMARDKNRYFFVQSGFNPEFARYSPLRLLITETMRHGFEDLGCEYFDLGPGYESYKYDWKPSIGTNYFCSIGGAGLYAKSLATLHRVAFRRRVLQSHDKNIKR